MTVSGLRREIKRGRLACEIIAGKQFVTLHDIKQMRDQCRVEQRAPASTSESVVDARPFGSSSTKKTRPALAAARVIAEVPKKPSPATSQEAKSHKMANFAALSIQQSPALPKSKPGGS
jgi:hypothetical protein